MLKADFEGVSMLVKAGFRAVGSRGSIEGVALVDTGASFTTLDRGLPMA